MTFRSMSAIAVVMLALGASPCGRAVAADSVVAIQDASSVTMTNGRLAVRILKADARIASLRFDGKELIAGGGGYWSMLTGDREDGDDAAPGGQSVFAVCADPASNGGAAAEVAISLPRGGRRGPPVDAEFRYRLARGDTAIHAWAILRRPAGGAPVDIGEARIALKLHPRVFDFLVVDANRRRLMPSGYDWDHGERLNLGEARRMTTGIHAGEAEHKYDYSAMLSAVPAYGWCGSKGGPGFWMINPSLEYIAGGATKVDLTGHLDGNRGGLPTLLNMWNGSHYGGASIRVPQGPSWSKVIGPFVLYVNSGGDPDALWRDALRRAAAERAAWPYAWAAGPEFPAPSGRGTVTGRLVVADPQAPGVTSSNAWIGLVAGAAAGEEPLDWQRDGTHYQYWTKAASDGRFAIRHVRPGTYDLRAFADGVLGECRAPGITVAAGRTNELGVQTWVPRRFGRQLWQIGTADRTAAEFRHGDEYWHWGLYLKYPEEFPNDVDFVIGKSDPRRDWNYAQPPRSVAGGRVKDTTWTIRFDLPAAPRGKATLRLALCGSRERGRIDVSVNGSPVGTTGELPSVGTMHRDGIRGYWYERPVTFDAALMKAGTNSIALRSRARDWTSGVMYDCVRLELDEGGTSP